MTPIAARVEAQAKINLHLRVLGRESSGYHQIETLYQRISLADTVAVHTGGAGRSLDCRGADVGPTEHNLAWRAALGFAEATGWPSSFAIEIEKRIPVGGGLGGGSADAGAVLRLLLALAPPPVARAAHGALASLAARLGADVPFLAGELPLAIGLGRGERLLPLAPLPDREVLLCAPSFGVSSATAFGWLAESRGGCAIAQHSALQTLRPVSWTTIAGFSGNDLEVPVFEHHPVLSEIRDELERAGATVARMSGTGSTVFGVFGAANEARTAARPNSCTSFSVRTLSLVAAVETL